MEWVKFYEVTFLEKIYNKKKLPGEVQLASTVKSLIRCLRQNGNPSNHAHTKGNMDEGIYTCILRVIAPKYVYVVGVCNNKNKVKEAIETLKDMERHGTWEEMERRGMI